MDARAAESTVILERDSWLQRERASGRFYDRLRKEDFLVYEDNKPVEVTHFSEIGRAHV